MTELPNDIECLKVLILQLSAQNEQLLAEIDQLKAENAELRRRLGMDSTNSHQPPGSDGLKKKTTSRAGRTPG